MDGESSAKKRRRVRRTGDDVMAIRCSPDQRLDPNDSVSSRRQGVISDVKRVNLGSDGDNWLVLDGYLCYRSSQVLQT